jgi:oligoendopeptidase F
MELAAREQPVSNVPSNPLAPRPSGEPNAMLFLEVPAKVHELLLGLHLLETTTDPHVRRWVLLHVIGALFGSLRGTLLGAHLERRLHALGEADQAITAGVVGEQQAAVFTRFFGDAIELDAGARLQWMLLPHHYILGNCFVYPAGLAAAYAVVEAIRSEGAPAAAHWREALGAGSSLPPLEALRLAGADLRTPAPLYRFAAFFGRLIDELEENVAGD